MRQKRLTPAPRERAAELLVTDDLTDEQIAQQVGIVRQTLTRWKRHPEVQARLQALRDAAAA